jgi:raffinose/stachyose/melibiose transport system substrate-binding protein
MGSKAGFIDLPPPASDNKHVIVLGWVGQTFEIAAKSAHPQVAAAFLDFMISSRAAQLYIQNGSLPVFATTTSTAGGSTLRQDVLAAIAMAGSNDGIVPYMNDVGPTMGGVNKAKIQDLIAGRIAPSDYVSAVQAEYAKGTGN